MTDTTFPRQITAGNSIAAVISLSEYPASDGWSLSYILLNSSSKITITTSADGDSHEIDVAPTTTAAYTAGEYKYTALVTDGTDRFTVDSGTVKVLPDPSELSTYDGRSHAEKMVDAIESLEQGVASTDVAAFSIAGRSITKLTPEERLRWLNHYKFIVEKERNGGNWRRTINTRFPA